ncbi:unnamed protein product [Triticum turgidum subsp. durum]|uniref:Uncharacterized protein n=1 Tax=Triticum turgidum subsp. durum TaxID=4567 RepID=A0A9R0WPG8_TRITD|nr:unnamed protein product [Triticum turgidum subsp. durum]
MEPEENPNRPPSRLDCIKYFNALWSCYSPFHQMQNYYRYGVFDNCSSKWRDLVDCLTLKTKSKAEVEEMLMAREKARPHFWTYRTVDEASANWWKMYKHRVMMSSPPKTADLFLSDFRLQTPGLELMEATDHAATTALDVYPLIRS